MTNTDAPFTLWLNDVRGHFPQREEFELASAIYSFSSAWEDGKTPQEAYDDFDAWCCESAS